MTRIARHAPGDPVPIAYPGDFILTHSTFFTGRLIRFGQNLRWRGDRRPYARWNHAAIVLDGGSIVEALGHGVEHNILGKYRETEYVLVHTGTTPADAAQIRTFALDVCRARTRYGYLDIVSLGLTLAIPLPIQFGSPGTAICSGLVAESLTRAGHVFGTSPEYAMPADLAEHFGVRS